MRRMFSKREGSAPVRAPVERLLGSLVALAFVALGCDGPYASNEPAEFDGDQGGFDAGGGGSDNPPPPGTLPELELTAPAVSPGFVFVANTSRGTLAKVALDGTAIRIETIAVGARPTVVLAAASRDRAFVLNSGSDSVSVVDAGPFGGEDDVSTFDIAEGCNRLDISPDADAAVAWFDAARAATGDLIGAISEVSVLRVGSDAGRAAQVSVGVGIRDVRFSDDGGTAFVVTDEGVSIVDLSADGDRFVPPVAITEADEPWASETDRDVLLTADGARALVRFGAEPFARVAELGTGDWTDVALGAAPTSTALVPDADRAVVGLRELEQIAVIDLAVPGEPFVLDVGIVSPRLAVAPTGTRALAFAAPLDETRVAIVDLDSDAVSTVNVRKSVVDATFAPGGRFAVLLHSRAPGEPVAGEPEADIIAKSHAVTAIDVETGAVKLVRLDAQPSAIAFDPSGTTALVLAADEASRVNEVLWIELDTFRTTTLRFTERPEHIGVLPEDGAAFVAQDHPLGRIAFIDLETGEQREVTGFELNGFIE